MFMLHRYLVVRKGSMHGYDIISHRNVDPEIGSNEDLETFRLPETTRHGHDHWIWCRTIWASAKENRWWMDVLENAPAHSLSTISTSIGRRSSLSCEARSLFLFWANSTEMFYRTVSSNCISIRNAAPWCSNTTTTSFRSTLYLSSSAWSAPRNSQRAIRCRRVRRDGISKYHYCAKHLPGHMESTASTERIREKRLQMRRLAELVRRNPAFTEFIEQNLKTFEVQGSDRNALMRMHILLEARLTGWLNGVSPMTKSIIEDSSTSTIWLLCALRIPESSARCTN